MIERSLKLQQELEKKQKDLLEKEEKIRLRLEYLRTENEKKRISAYEAKKEKVVHMLTENEEKMKNRINTFYKLKQEKQERFEKVMVWRCLPVLLRRCGRPR